MSNAALRPSIFAFVEGGEAIKLKQHEKLYDLEHRFDGLPFVVYPHQKWVHYWDQLVVLSVLFVFFFSMPQAAFDTENEIGTSSFAGVLKIISETIFLAEFVISFRTAYVIVVGSENFVIDDGKRMALNYLHGWCIFDLLSINLPYHGTAYSLSDKYSRSILNLFTFFFRLFRFAKVDRLYHKTFKGNKARIFRLFMHYFVLCHVFGTLFYLLGEWQIVILEHEQSWITMHEKGNDGKTIRELDVFERYGVALYWAIITISTTGYGDITPTNNLEMVFANIGVVLGTVTSVYIMGNVTQIVVNLERHENEYKQQLDAMEELVMLYRLPSTLKDRLLKATNHRWNKTRGFNMDEALSHVPAGLASDVKWFLHADTVLNQGLFKGCSKGMLRTVLNKLTSMHMPVHEVIFRHGDCSTEMYFIREGQVVILDPRQNVKATLENGTAFGEVGLFGGTMESTRTGTAVVTEASELFVLTRTDFEAVTAHFPELHHILLSKINSYNDLAKKKTLETSLEPLKPKTTKNISELDNKVRSVLVEPDAIGYGLPTVPPNTVPTVPTPMTKEGFKAMTATAVVPIHEFPRKHLEQPHEFKRSADKMTLLTTKVDGLDTKLQQLGEQVTSMSGMLEALHAIILNDR